MKLVAGLGNPGSRYTRNRHNVGFMVVDRIAKEEGARFERRRGNAYITEAAIGGERVLLAKPQTYMNLSGGAVGKLAAAHRLARSDVLVIYDDLDLPLGTLRLRADGSSGGHHGMESILHVLGGTDVPRLRIGIGRPDPQHDVGHVLGNFSGEELDTLDDVIARAAAAVRLWIQEGIVRAMNKVNER